VKANGYGHGDIEVSKKALACGADSLAVAILDEAIHLRKAGIKAPILVFGWIRPRDAPLAASLDISVTVFQKEWMKEVKSHDFKNKLKVQLKVDTGMGRIGFRTK
jgi:alanine racemase